MTTFTYRQAEPVYQNPHSAAAFVILLIRLFRHNDDVNLSKTIQDPQLFLLLMHGNVIRYVLTKNSRLFLIVPMDGAGYFEAAQNFYLLNYGYLWGVVGNGTKIPIW